MRKDFLIIGQGLAGSFLGWQLSQRNHSFLIIDSADVNASKVAAGLINPITGKRWVKANDFETVHKNSCNEYQKLGEYFSEQFYHEKKMLRLIRDKEELEIAMQRASQTGYMPYLNISSQENRTFTNISGLIEQYKSGWVNIVRLLDCLKNYFIELNSYNKDIFRYQDLYVEEGIKWKDMTFKKIIFCEGYELINNPFFNWLPLQPAKGETLSLMPEDTNLDESLRNNLINYGYWLFSSDGKEYKTGASYENDNFKYCVTEEAREELMSVMKKYIPAMNQSFVIEQQFGIRPATPDREPMIGKHPKYDNFFVFNGFGSKGALKIPFYCQCLIDYMTFEKPLPGHVDIKRYEGK